MTPLNRFCITCGSALSPDDTFCVGCGTRVDAPVPVPAVEVLIPTAVAQSAPGGIFGGKKALETENAALRAAFEAIGATEREQIKRDIERLRVERSDEQATLAQLRNLVVETRETAILQEVGLYEYTHPLESAVHYKEQLTGLQAQIKDLAKTNRAIHAATSWNINGSEREGKKMVTDLSKLMLRAYNTEADELVRALKPYKREAAIERLTKARQAISRLGTSLQIAITDDYHRLRISEIQLTADFRAKEAEEKERDKEERARLREEEKAQRELEREMDKSRKEATHYETALAAIRETGTAEEIADLEAKLAEANRAIEEMAERQANTRIGFVYVISNVGSFGERVVKIGLSRRVDPLERVRELGDASVPFRYDVHAMIFSKDAVDLETRLHQHFADRRVNLVNQHREFFYATPVEVRNALEQFDHSLLTFVEAPEADEWHQSENVRSGDA
jgi:hypothetical protein